MFRLKDRDYGLPILKLSAQFKLLQRIVLLILKCFLHLVQSLQDEVWFGSPDRSVLSVPEK